MMGQTRQQADAVHSGKEPPHGNQRDGEPHEAVASSIKQPVSEIGPQAIKEQAITEQPSSYDLRDLQAQEDMAFWAMLMFFAALATFAVTSIGTFLIWRQIKLTREAVEDTGKATAAMVDANEIARMHMRPIVRVEQTGSIALSDGLDIVLGANIVFTGGAAIRDLEIRGASRFDALPDMSHSALLYSESLRSAGGGRPIHVDSQNTRSPAEHNEMLAKYLGTTYVFHFWVLVAYRDIFGVRVEEERRLVFEQRECLPKTGRYPPPYP